MIEFFTLPSCDRRGGSMDLRALRTVVLRIRFCLNISSRLVDWSGSLLMVTFGRKQAGREGRSGSSWSSEVGWIMSAALTLGAGQEVSHLVHIFFTLALWFIQFMHTHTNNQFSQGKSYLDGWSIPGYGSESWIEFLNSIFHNFVVMSLVNALSIVKKITPIYKIYFFK